MSNVRSELLEEKPFKLMVKLCVPAIIGMLVVGLYSFVDAVFVGQFVGPNAMGAVSVAYPFTLINNGIATLVGVGSASILSRAIGKKDNDTVDKVMGNLLVLITILSILITVIGITFTRQILSLSGATGEILDLAERYLKIIFVGSIFINFAQSANMVMRAEGLMKKAMFYMGIGAVVNIVLDLAVIATGKYSVEAAALTSIIAQIVQAVITFIYFAKKSKIVRFHRIRIEKAFLPQIFSVGLSAMLMQLMSLLQQTVMYNTAATYGNDAQIILIGAALRVQAFSFIPLWGMSQGLQPVVGTNYGAKQYGRVKKCTNTFILGAIALSLVFWIPIELAPKAVLSLFIKDTEIVSQGIFNFRLMYSVFPALGIMIMGLTFFQSIGKGGKASVLVLLRQIILFIPILLILPKYFGVIGIWAASPLTDGIILITTIILLITQYRNMGNEENLASKAQ
ncbi:MATE family efflux transporter [Faecalispora jeddahensis]|uniref:MATE family efflux transporter n=1 Tax=Faecalispora jeddahensis TaxID=1414721 RepID=UPI00189BC287|nr:MATE family efflux transporter [Faecalispora jeddahensis]